MKKLKNFKIDNYSNSNGVENQKSKEELEINNNINNNNINNNNKIIYYSLDKNYSKI